LLGSNGTESGRVDQMVDQNEAYTFQKRGIFYFSKRVPSDWEKEISEENKC